MVAYIIVETETGKDKGVLAEVGFSLPGCKAFPEIIVRGEVVAALHCDDLDALNESVMEITKKDVKWRNIVYFS